MYNPVKWALAAALFAVLGCTAKGDKDAAEGELTVQATLSPSTPKVGVHTMEVHVLRAGQPVEGAVITVTPFMPEHGHGSTDTPHVIESGGGVYRATPVTFIMSGTWEVTVDAKAGSARGRHVFTYSVGK